MISWRGLGKMALRVGESGAVIVEAALVLFPLVLMLTLLVELHRRVFEEVLLHHVAFIAVRARVWGSPAKAERSVAHFLDQVVGPKFGASYGRSLKVDFGYGQTCFARVYRRFPLLLPFRRGAIRKHHFEVTRRCRFSCSVP